MACVVKDCEPYVAGKEQEYSKELTTALEQSSFEEVYARLRKANSSSPSFFLYSAAAVLSHSAEHAELAARICSNCLEINLQDVQMMRSVGYFLIKAGKMDLAIAVLDRVRVLAPAEPQSFLDGALARALLCLRGAGQEVSLRDAVALTTTAITHRWADRFADIEWPALVLLHLLVDIGKERGFGDLWPADLDFRAPDFSLGLFIWLGWDTDHTDVDLHVVEPSGNEVFYSNPRSSIGGHVSRDFQHGYGPEVYCLKKPVAGTYTVKAKYYASHQQSTTTGATSAVLWALRTAAGGASGSSAPERELIFDTVRLDRNKEKMEVMQVVIPKRAVPTKTPSLPVQQEPRPSERIARSASCITSFCKRVRSQ